MPATREPEAQEIANAIREGLRRNGHGRSGGTDPFAVDVGAGILLRDEEAGREAATRIAHATLSAASVETAAHSDDVDVIADGICARLGVDGQERRDILTAARLHDIGKVAVPDFILNKPGPLEPDEWEVIRTHTKVGDEILRSVPALAGVATLVRHSHERWDGEGYPDGLAGEEIPLGSRIIFCADSFHAIRCDRVYRKGRSSAAALREVQAGAGTQFDPEVVEALVDLRRDLCAQARFPALSGRSARLMALLLVVSCGMGGAALARSGLFPGSRAEATPALAPKPIAPSVASATPRSLGDLFVRGAACGARACSEPAVSSALSFPPPQRRARRASTGSPAQDKAGGTGGALHSSQGSTDGGASAVGVAGNGPHENSPSTGTSHGGHHSTGTSHGGHHGSGAPPAPHGGGPDKAPSPQPHAAPPPTPPSGGGGEGDSGDSEGSHGPTESGGSHGNGNAYGHLGGLGNPDPGSGGNAYGHSGGMGNGSGVGNPHAPPPAPSPAPPAPPKPHGNPHAVSPPGAGPGGGGKGNGATHGHP